jgi:hypothetical protein
MFENLVRMGIMTETERAQHERYARAYRAYFESDPVGPVELRKREIEFETARKFV